MSRRVATEVAARSAPVIGYIGASVPATEGGDNTRELIFRRKVQKWREMVPVPLEALPPDFLDEMYWYLFKDIFVSPTVDPTEIHRQLDCATYHSLGYEGEQGGGSTVPFSESSFNKDAGYVLLSHPRLPIIVQGRVVRWYNPSQHPDYSTHGLMNGNPTGQEVFLFRGGRSMKIDVDVTLYDQFISDDMRGPSAESLEMNAWEEFPFYVEVTRVYWRGRESETELAVADRCWARKPLFLREKVDGITFEPDPDGTFDESRNNRINRLAEEYKEVFTDGPIGKLRKSYKSDWPAIEKSFSELHPSTNVWHSTTDLSRLPLILTANDGRQIPFPPTLAVDVNHLMMNPMSFANPTCDVFYTQSEDLRSRPSLTSQTPPPSQVGPVTSVEEFRSVFGENRPATAVEQSTLKIVPTRSTLRRNWLVQKGGSTPTRQQVADVLLDFVAGHHLKYMGCVAL